MEKLILAICQNFLFPKLKCHKKLKLKMKEPEIKRRWEIE